MSKVDAVVPSKRWLLTLAFVVVAVAVCVKLADSGRLGAEAGPTATMCPTAGAGTAIVTQAPPAGTPMIKTPPPMGYWDATSTP
jgi:hypothetical protein